MKICLVVTHFYPENNALTNRLKVLVPMLAEAHDVSIVYLLEPGKSYNEGRVREKFPQRTLRFYPLRAVSYDKSKALPRFLGEACNTFRLCWHVAGVPADLYWVSIPQLTLLPMASLFLQIWSGFKLVELRDLTWQYIKWGRGLAGRSLGVMIDKVALAAVRRFDFVLTCTDAQARYLEQAASIPSIVLRNGLAKERCQTIANRIDYRAHTDGFVVMYVGTIGLPQNLQTLAEAAFLLRRESGIMIEVIGDGPALAKLHQYVETHQLTNIVIRGRLEWDAVLESYSRASVLFTQLTAGSGLERAEPSKLFEYFATGKTVIYGGVGAGRDLAVEFENVYLIPPDSAEILAATIRELSGRPCRFSTKNQELIQRRHLREDQFRRFINVLSRRDSELLPAVH